MESEPLCLWKEPRVTVAFGWPEFSKDSVQLTAADLCNFLEAGQMMGFVAADAQVRMKVKCPVSFHKMGLQSGALVGHALGFWAFLPSAGRYPFMEDLFVAESLRGRGLGTALWAAFAKVRIWWRLSEVGEGHSLEAGGAGRLDWHVKGSNDARGFYGRLGALDLTTRDGLNELCLTPQATHTPGTASD